jgi:GNAT superfamily N-acetyltransferase
MILTEAGPDSLDLLRDLAVRANDTPYSLESVIEEKCFAAGAGGLPRLAVAGDGNVLDGAVVVSGRYLRLLLVDRARRRQGIGQALLEWAAALARQHGESRLVLGGEPGNYFVPGIIKEQQETRDFFHRRGFSSKEEAVNLVAHVGGTDWNARRKATSEVTIERASDSEEALDFIGREFGRLWRFEVSHAFRESTPPLFLARDSSGILGFSAHDVNNRGLGFYGPAGVTQSRRGAGLGRELLLASLADLAQRGYDRIVIPWVSSIEFYRKVANAEVDMTFDTMEKKL